MYIKSKAKAYKLSAVFVGIALAGQVLLGVSNILFSLPISIAVAHNVVAACLLMTMIALTYHLRCKNLAKD